MENGVRVMVPPFITAGEKSSSTPARWNMSAARTDPDKLI